MKFKDLSDKDRKQFVKIYKNKEMSWDDRMELLMKLTNKSERTVRRWASNKLGLSEKEEVPSPQYEEAKKRVFDKKKKRFIITWAQNNTEIHKEFFKNIKAYADFIDADIHIIAGRYKNPTSIWTCNNQNEERWHKDVVPYLDANRHDIHKYLSILSDIKIQPTAVSPMTGMQGVSGVNSCVFGSPRVHLEMIPVLEGNKPKMMLTTGALTVKNYTDSKAGKKGEFHHTFGFVIVEIEDKNSFHIRQVTANDEDGSFSDLFYHTQNGEVTKIDEIEGIVLGDLHCGHHDEDVLDSTFDLMSKLKPKHVVLHDVFDGDSISHHQMKDPFLQYGKEVHNLNDLRLELENMYQVLRRFENFENVVIVKSNHDDFLDRWLKNEDWKKQPTFKNAPLYMELSAKLLKQYGNGIETVKGVIPELINEKFPKFLTLNRNSSYKIKGFETGQHGDFGTNGSRGSLEQFRKLNTKIIVAHYHSCGRKDGALSVGTSTKLRVGYNIGPSSWLQSHVIIHKDGRAQHINFIKDNDNKANYTTF
jgi:hypothetical protein